MLTFKSFTGDEITQYLNEVARLRIQVFRDYPYLYDGDTHYETRYLQTYIQSPHSLIVLAFDGEKVVGASTGLPLTHETAEVKAPFEQAGFDIDTLFYCGESVLLPEYRGLGAGVTFFEYREGYAKQVTGVTHSCFCAVMRPAKHPDKPDDFIPLDAFWKNRGYYPCPELTTEFSWKEVHETNESTKPMMFWMKSLEAGTSNTKKAG